MRNLFIIAMMLGGAFMAGWFTINREGDRTTIEFNRSEIRDDTRHAIERGRELLDHEQPQFQGEGEPWSGQQYPADPGAASQQYAAQGQPVTRPVQQSSYTNEPYQANQNNGQNNGQGYEIAPATNPPSWPAPQQRAAAPQQYNAPQSQPYQQPNVRY